MSSCGRNAPIGICKTIKYAGRGHFGNNPLDLCPCVNHLNGTNMGSRINKPIYYDKTLAKILSRIMNPMHYAGLFHFHLGRIS